MSKTYYIHKKREYREVSENKRQVYNGYTFVQRPASYVQKLVDSVPPATKTLILLPQKLKKHPSNLAH